jgi:RES domain-containing protein
LRSLWRICQRRFRALDGEGARRAGGRWNSKGVPVVYTAGSLSLATLELFVHVRPFLLSGRSRLTIIEILIPDAVRIEQLKLAKLPSGWRRYPAPVALQRIGDAWIRSARTLLLRVPSAVTLGEYNYLINPSHPDISRLVVRAPVPFLSDRRLSGR